MLKNKKLLATNFGKPVDDDQNSVTADAYGPVLMQDVHLIDNIVTKLYNAKKEIQIRQTKIFFKTDHDYGRRIAKDLKLDLEQFKNIEKAISR